MNIQSYGNTIVCKGIKPEDKKIGKFIIPSKYNDDTQLFEIIEFGRKYNKKDNLKIGDKVVISESNDNILVDHDGEKYFICNPNSIIAVFNN